MPSPEPLTPMLVAELVGNIYEAALEPRLWRPLVERIERIYPELTILMFSHEASGADELSVVLNYPEAALRDYAAYYFAHSPYVDFVPRNQVGRPTLSEVIISEAELHRTEYYTDFMRPHRLSQHGCGMVLEREPAGWASLSFADQHDDIDRRAHQMTLLGLLAPHFARALKLRRALIAARAPGTAQQAVFDGWAHAAFVLDAEGRVATMNRRAEALIARSEGITLNRRGQPRSFDDRCSRALEAAVAHCRLRLADEALNGVMLPRAGRAPLHAMLWPLALVSDFGVPTMPGQVLMIVSDPEDTPPGAVAWIGRRFGLSPSEEKLADAVIAGVPLSEAAERLGIQLSTARTRLKMIQAKTGCHRQLDLVRLAMSVPGIHLR
ncbi:helix-turn-helix transcriptional regulator [Sphingomonas sp. HITSZ_GF]|uniref:helix-turn-helix transcriptional regulator n=1 Tax=Sphingomonas sp. HITSZ_GF TaxID=3037247 RepID=UPI00240CF5B3|nr:helix-turn-helix transcriptional regulator [Sphingomonas sp. HITSZ_GF]MDG2534811.1 helix-turn-helix transcriptional regulator [Sphingomonas sp. HITSZ_GF]